ncbi:hypothetical protein NCS56_01548000 [Fusarium sp. Ph1]|nr:hypothetical protein NCS56_01548000 [Fusarium sp. Ph1]
MDMVQVTNLDKCDKKQMQEDLGSPSDLQPIEQQEENGLRYYAMSQKHENIIELFQRHADIALQKRVKAAGQYVCVDVKHPFRLSVGANLSAQPGQLLVLLPLYEEAFCVQYRSPKSGEWRELPWEPGTYVSITGGSAVRVTSGGAVYGLSILFIWRATPSNPT